MDPLQAKYADKISKLLRKAESTTPEEAEMLLEKAQDLMTRYAIEEAMLHAANGATVEEIVREEVTYAGVYHPALFSVGSAVAQAQGCRVLISKGSKTSRMVIIGFRGDVERAIMLDSSVQIQAAAAIAAWAREDDSLPSWMTAMQKFKARREFLFGFAKGVKERLAIATRQGEEGHVADNSPGLADDREVRTGMELVMRSRKERVDEWVDNEYGRTLRSVRSNYSHGGWDAASAGRTAGRNANTGSSGALRNRP